MTTDPDTIRADIERTRMQLSNDVNSLTHEANPKTMASRRVEKARSALSRAKDKIMGGDDDSPAVWQPPSSGNYANGGTFSNAASSVGDAASSVGDAVTSAPANVRAQTQGNPLAAGLIAFGAGALLGSLLPASSQEQRAAEKVKDAAQPVVAQLGEAAKESAASLKEPAQEAMESVKSTATEAAANVKDEGASAAQDVKDKTTDSVDQVKSTRE